VLLSFLFLWNPQMKNSIFYCRLSTAGCCIAWVMAVLILAGVLPNAAFGVPSSGELHTFTQPDGTVIEVRLKGDEYFSWHETDLPPSMYPHPELGCGC